MSPSPLFVATVGYGIKGGWKAGLRVAYGHTVVALPLAILLGIGAISFATFPHFRESISILGAISLFLFAAFQVRNILLRSPINHLPGRGPFFIGIILSALNPYFVVWWFTIGLKLISDALIMYSITGFAIMFTSHLWMEYAWLILVAFLSGRGKKILATKNYQILGIALNGVLVYFGITFLLQA